ncbi:hypothetical protein EIM50_19235 [Pseudoxanthomonas sp. SGD-10]|nr:hypothetical protein EIM50_19235 [Pseudoxanthomonas sp. SGD-10]
MARTFQIVEFKIAETDFFLDKLEQTTYDSIHFFEARNFLSAFLASSRSITFSLQASLHGITGFKEWYDIKQQTMRESRLAKYFLEARNNSQKVGYYPLTGGRTYRDSNNLLRVEYYFDTSTEELAKFVPEEDVLTACKKYFKMILEVVFDCYQDFGTVIDPEQYFSFENIKKTGKTIEDFEEELGYPRGWTNIPDATDDDRLKAIRNEITCHGIDHILIKYLGKNRFGDIVTEN